MSDLPIHASNAKRHTTKYIKEAVEKGYYRRKDLRDLAMSAGDAMEGYESVDFYVFNGMGIPCTATTKAGKSYAKGNYWDFTRRQNLH